MLDEIDFLRADKQRFLEVDLNTLDIKVSYKMILSLLMDIFKHFQTTQSNKSTISLQYLKKEVRDGFFCCMHVNIKVSTSGHYRFLWNWPVSKLPKIGSW